MIDITGAIERLSYRLRGSGIVLVILSALFVLLSIGLAVSL